MGKPTKDLLDWADQARNSDPYKQSIVRMMFRQAMSREVLPHEQQEFEAIWKALPDDKYSINKLLHRLIDTKAFGGRKQ